MLKQVADAIKREDYEAAHRLLQTLQPQELDNPWLLYYQARVDEARGNHARANLTYREILTSVSNPKLIAQTRQGIERIEQINHQEQQLQRQEKQEEIFEAKAALGGLEPGVLILEPIPLAEKQYAAQEFGRIMQIDAYTARLQLPSRSWRLYRVGPIGELQVHVNALQSASISCFCETLATLSQISIYPVSYFESVIPRVTVLSDTRLGSEAITFDWSEVSQRVEGLLPLLEEYQEFNTRGQTQRKTKTLDYAQVCDLHLPKKKLILRLCDQHYGFQKGIVFSERQQSKSEPTTLRDNWNQMMQYVKAQSPDVPVLSDFTPFAETALEFAEPLRQMSPQVNILRTDETPWDAAFELYSGLAFLKLTGRRP
jgi:hypothetical protein